jgi:hypothetical protein
MNRARRWRDQVSTTAPRREPLCSPLSEASLSALTALAIAPRAAENEVLMLVMGSWTAKVRKWLGLGKTPVNAPHGNGAP